MKSRKVQVKICPTKVGEAQFWSHLSNISEISLLNLPYANLLIIDLADLSLVQQYQVTIEQGSAEAIGFYMITV